MEERILPWLSGKVVKNVTAFTSVPIHIYCGIFRILGQNLGRSYWLVSRVGGKEVEEKQHFQLFNSLEFLIDW